MINENFLIYFLICIVIILIGLYIFFSSYEFLKIIYFFILSILFVYFLRKKISEEFNQKIGFDIFSSFLTFLFLFPIIIKAPYLRLNLQHFNKLCRKNKKIIMGNQETQRNILEAVWMMSQKQIGALITIEKYNTLEQFAQKSILIDGYVSQELLVNIFIPNSPLHDGAVIIRGNKILSAGAYFMLSEKPKFSKSTGSRHRAALGISENTDSMTLVVSEETGNISIALEGIILKMKDKNQIQEYLTTFMI